MSTRPARSGEVDMSAAITRSLLGYGVLAGALYLVVGISLAATREGFELTSHPLSVLMLGEGGWMQRTNIAVAGSMTLAAAVGFTRALRGSRAALRSGVAVGAYGAALVLSGVFPPDPMAGFPPGATAGDPSISGIMHMIFGAVGFLAIAAAASFVARWFAGAGMRSWARASRIAAAVVLIAFVGGAALATQVTGVALLWIAVLSAWSWLGATSVRLYRSVPHPDLARRTPPPAI